MFEKCDTQGDPKMYPSLIK